MTTLATPAGPSPLRRVGALAAAETRLLARNRTAVVNSVLMPLLLVGFVAVVGGYGLLGADLLVAAAGFTLVFLTYYNLVTTYVARREDLVLQRLRTGELSDGQVLLATAVPTLLVTAVQIGLVAAGVAVLGRWTAPVDPVLPVLAVLLGATVMVLLATASTVFTRTPESAQITTLPVVMGATALRALLPAQRAAGGARHGGPAAPAHAGDRAGAAGCGRAHLGRRGGRRRRAVVGRARPAGHAPGLDRDRRSGDRAVVPLVPAALSDPGRDGRYGSMGAVPTVARWWSSRTDPQRIDLYTRWSYYSTLVFLPLFLLLAVAPGWGAPPRWLALVLAAAALTTTAASLVLAQQGFRDRAVVRGYRRTDLPGELAGARSVLRAAGVGVTVTGEEEAGTLPEPVQTALGWVVREAVTNVLRHSRASWCAVELRAAGGEAELQVTNDGARGSGTTWGNGLTGLAERLAATGGRLSAGPDGDRFVLAATVPARVPA
jgi:hypothetical protein